MKGYIRLTDVISEMDKLDEYGKPVKFQIKFVTADIKRNTGGEVIEIVDGRKCVGKKNGEVIFDTRKAVTEPKMTKSPNHFINATRNILLPNGQIRKVHIRLIIEFNHTKVCF